MMDWHTVDTMETPEREPYYVVTTDIESTERTGRGSGMWGQHEYATPQEAASAIYLAALRWGVKRAAATGHNATTLEDAILDNPDHVVHHLRIVKVSPVMASVVKRKHRNRVEVVS